MAVIIEGKTIRGTLNVIFNNGKKGRVHDVGDAWFPFKLIEVDGRQFHVRHSNGDWAVKEYIRDELLLGKLANTNKVYDDNGHPLYDETTMIFRR